MKKDKEFDCVEMKWEIQRQIAEETKGMSDEEAHAYLWKDVLDDPILGPFVKNLKRYKPPQPVGK